MVETQERGFEPKIRGPEIRRSQRCFGRSDGAFRAASAFRSSFDGGKRTDFCAASCWFAWVSRPDGRPNRCYRAQWALRSGRSGLSDRGGRRRTANPYSQTVCALVAQDRVGPYRADSQLGNARNASDHRLPPTGRPGRTRGDPRCRLRRGPATIDPTGFRAGLRQRRGPWKTLFVRDDEDVFEGLWAPIDRKSPTLPKDSSSRVRNCFQDSQHIDRPSV